MPTAGGTVSEGESDHRAMTALTHPRVLLVDDSEMILDRATASLSNECEIVGAVTDGPSALEAVRTLRPDVIVMDISMPGMSGIEVAGQLRRGGSTVPIVFLTIHDDEQLVQATQAAGGIGYVLKKLLPTDLIIAVNEAYAGRRYVSQLR
jgi:DNA-binding NarL/FixJ family response regulator